MYTAIWTQRLVASTNLIVSRSRVVFYLRLIPETKVLHLKSMENSCLIPALQKVISRCLRQWFTSSRTNKTSHFNVGVLPILSITPKARRTWTHKEILVILNTLKKNCSCINYSSLSSMRFFVCCFLFFQRANAISWPDYTLTVTSSWPQL